MILIIIIRMQILAPFTLTLKAFVKLEIFFELLVRFISFYLLN
jgi:hypothetical protein